MRKKNKKRIYKTTIIFIILDLIVIGCFIMMYGPWDKIRNLYVTTAMQTMSHKYFANIFYSQKTIEKIQSKNYLIALEEDTNTDEIKLDNKERDTYENEYERELLTRDKGNEDYKLLNIKVGNANGYLVAIYDPTKVKLLRVKNFNTGSFGERVVDMCKRYNGAVCINGGGFANGLSNGSDIPQGYVIDEGKVVWPQNNSDSKGNIIGMTSEGNLKLMTSTTGNEAIEAGIKYGIEFGPFLIVNGKSVTIEGTPYGVANKCVIAQRKDGTILFLITEGETYIDGASLKDVVDVLEKYGAYNAANLDGGQSTSLVINNTLINSPNYLAKKQGGRYVVTGWGLIP